MQSALASHAPVRILAIEDDPVLSAHIGSHLGERGFAIAHAVGLRSGRLHYGLLCLISLAVVGALKASGGGILAIALLIAPGPSPRC